MARSLRLPRRARRVCVAAPLLLLAMGGCGLADYESKMERGQKLIEFIDKQNVYLGNPIEPPPPEKAPAGPDGTVVPKPKVELFLRLPKGVETKPEPATIGPDSLSLSEGGDHGDSAVPKGCTHPEGLAGISRSARSHEHGAKSRRILDRHSVPVRRSSIRAR